MDYSVALGEISGQLSLISGKLETQNGINQYILFAVGIVIGMFIVRLLRW